MGSGLFEIPGRLYVVATLLPLAVFVLMCVGGMIRALSRPGRHNSPTASFFYYLLGGDRPLKAGAYIATGVMVLSTTLAIIGLVAFLQEAERPDSDQFKKHWEGRVVWAEIGSIDPKASYDDFESARKLAKDWSRVAPEEAANKPAPGFHAKFAWKGSFDDLKLAFSVSGIEQQQKYSTAATDTAPAGTGSWQGTGGDVFGKLDFQGLELVAGGYYAKGLGTTGIFIFGADDDGNARTSYGYLVQATYKVGPTKFGINYGVSRLAFTNEADRIANPFLVAANEKVTGGVYYDLTKNLMILGEVSWVQDIAHTDSMSADGSIGNSNTGVTGNVGVFLAF